MPMNRVQFQQGLSLPEFMQRFSTEGQHAATLEAARWLSKARAADTPSIVSSKVAHARHFSVAPADTRLR